MNTPIRRILGIAFVVGVLGGAMAAVAIPRTHRPAAAYLAAAPARAQSVDRVVRVGAPLTSPSGQAYTANHRLGTAVIAARAADPRGGPPWAVRVVRIARFSHRGGRMLRIGTERCAQLGRLHGGHFGWLEANGTLRPIPTTYTGPIAQCGSPAADMGHDPSAGLAEPTTAVKGGAAHVVQTVAWAIAGPTATSVSLTVHGHRVPTISGPYGVVLKVLPTRTVKADLALTIDYPDHRPVRALPGRTPFLMPSDLQPPDVTPFTTTRPSILAAIAPDPNGGLPWGLIATPYSGGWCTSGGSRVVDGRAGLYVPNLDLLIEEDLGGGGCGPYPLQDPEGAHAQFAAIGLSGLPTRSRSADESRGHVERRTEPGVVAISGLANPNVKTLTFATSQDVRTIVPTGRAHGFIIVYTGGLHGSGITVTATLRNGKTERMTVPAPPF